MQSKARTIAVRKQFISFLFLTLFFYSTVWCVTLSDIFKNEVSAIQPEIISEPILLNLTPGDTSGIVLKTLRLKSQEWLGADWEHTVLFAYNEALSTTIDTAFVMITGDYRYEKDILQAVNTLLKEINALFVILFDVPNQPLLGGLKEDRLISETFSRYFQTQDPSIPLLVPMVRSVRKVMDWIEQTFEIRKFVLSGASKRGWTTYLTAAVDERVKGIIPISFDFLNFPEQLRIQREWYGTYSTEISAYTDKDFPAMLSEDIGKELLKIVDPYLYITSLAIPKICVVGTNDAYWHLFGWQNYFTELSGYKQMLYIPNKGHGVELFRPILAIQAMIDHVSHGTQLPQYAWEVNDREIGIEWVEQQDYSLLAAYLWFTRSETMDFRKSRWVSFPLPIEGNRIFAKVPDYGNENTSAFVELLFESRATESAGSKKLYLSTPTFLFPQTAEEAE